MNKEIYNNIEYYLTVDDNTFEKEIRSKAFNLLREENDSTVHVSALLATTNVCKNTCTYCGLNKNNRNLKRFSLKDADIIKSIEFTKDSELKEIFFISGENPAFKLERYLKHIEYAKSLGLKTNLAIGTLKREEYQQLKNAGLDMYTIKFESSNPKIFKNCKIDIDFEKRMDSIRAVKDVGLQLGSSSIVGLKGSTIEDLVNDIKLTADLNVDWVPIVPYLPATNTEMGKDTPPGDINLTLRAISILRLLLPKSRITAAQPKKNSKYGFGDRDGNLAALKSGANILFVELTPIALQNKFAITDNRKLPRLEETKSLALSLNLQVK